MTCARASRTCCTKAHTHTHLHKQTRNKGEVALQQQGPGFIESLIKGRKHHACAVHKGGSAKQAERLLALMV